MLTSLLQPPDSTICGPVAVAMATGVSVDVAVAAFGVTMSDGASIPEIVGALEKLGYVTERVIRTRGNRKIRRIPSFCIAIMDHKDTRYLHSVAIEDGFVYDPGIGYPFPLHVYEDYIMYSASYASWRKVRDEIKVIPARWRAFIPIVKPPQLVSA